MLISTPIHYHRELKFSGLNELYVIYYICFVFVITA